MPTDKTIGTELGFCFGVLGINPSKEIDEMLKVQNVDRESLGRFLNYYDKNPSLIDLMHDTGKKTRPYISNKVVLSPSSTSWEGSKKQAGLVRVSRDLVFSSVLYVSVKAESDVIFNKSPSLVFEHLPRGDVTTEKKQDWYLQVARDKYQELYSFFNPESRGYPSQIEDYCQSKGRGSFKDIVNNNYNEDARHLYHKLCKKVSQESADIFNNNLSQKDILSEYLFRINSVSYILAGIDCKNQFAVEVPDSTTWKNNYRLEEVYAYPVSAGQPEVGIRAKVCAINTKEYFNFDFSVEVRWSHGKFNGNPEAKLYKKFAYKDVPWCYNII